ncbi:MAG: hypothetical protein IKJ79_00045 [Bacteroidaceae bacterium]|nr:hypothetical protein [Bacteroidaceae bacterium]
MENKTKKVEIEIPVGKVVKWVDGVLTLVDEKPQDVTERIKTFEDALDELEVRAANGDNKAKMLYDDWHNVTTDSDDLIAYLQLRIITAALNEGWEPQFTKGERRWYFWYDLITKEQYDKLSDKDKSRVVGRGGNSAVASCGLVYAGANDASSYSYTNFGSRLAFKSEKLAAYAGRQFAEIYADFCFKPKSEETKG